MEIVENPAADFGEIGLLSTFLRIVENPAADFGEIGLLSNIQMNSSITSVLSTVVVCVAFHASSAAEPIYKVVTKNADDRVSVETTTESSTFIVESPRGIGSAVIHRPLERWSDRAIVFRLRLKGLEEFRVTQGETSWSVAVSSGDQSTRLSFKQRQQERNISEPTDRFWAEVRTKDFFEVKLPKAMLAENPESITINWVDFFR